MSTRRRFVAPAFLRSGGNQHTATSPSHIKSDQNRRTFYYRIVNEDDRTEVWNGYNRPSEKHNDDAESR